MTTAYLNNISKTTAQGDAREESYYPYLKSFIDDFSNSIGKTKTQVTTLPKKTEAGNPDFRVWDGKQHIVGYIEAKKPGENLDTIETSAQLKRYRNTFPNLILTDFYEFRLYRNGQLIDKISIGRPFIAKKLHSVPPLENEDKFHTLLEKFFSFSLPKVFTAENLATELANRTKFLRDEVIAKELEEEELKKGAIYGFYTAFKNYLVAGLSQKDFADIYSQTITYGLFAARSRAGKSPLEEGAESVFNRKLAYDLIPPTIGILRDVFHFISFGKPPLQMEVIIDDISEVLQAADVNKILDEYYRKGKGEDPIVHFYETFLNVYDPATREKRGVYYTPEPVVKYIVRSIHELLKTHFDLQDGLASKEVTLLDPAGGTLTFPAEAIKLAVEEFVSKYGDGGKNNFIKKQLLKNFYAFELMMAPYAIGHIKISFLLEELGYKMEEDDRFKLYLTNTLDMEDLQQTEIPGLESLSEESHEAGKVKQREKILVILGNPPYSGHSANSNEWTEKLLKENIDGAQSYYEVDGQPLGEKNPKWLQDDYVKFLRFAQWKINKAGMGVIGMITNHSYLDNPTFRGMRQSLQRTFNEIYIIDLHGNAKKKEVAPDGSKDENVFDIQQGTAIVVMIKKKSGKGCKVFHRDIYGLRETKYDWLEKRKFKRKDYQVLKPEAPWYFLIKRNTKEIEHYAEWMRIDEIFPVNNVGIVTARDELTIKWTASEMINTVRIFGRIDIELARQTYNLGKDVRDWKVSLAQEDLKKSGFASENIVPILYRPFDTRFTYYTGNSRGFHCMPRGDVMQHMLKPNIALTVGRQGQVVGSEYLWNLAFISEEIIDFNLFYRGGELLFPLYLYPTPEKKKKNPSALMLFEPEANYGSKEKQPNIAAKVFEKLNAAYLPLPGRGVRGEVSPEQILYYCYAVLYSNTYREKYAEFLKIDFPRIPFTKDYELFKGMAVYGEELAQLHLLKHKALNYPLTKFHSLLSSGRGAGGEAIERPSYNEEEQRVYINSTRYFDNISPQVWNYQIGGYQVMEKYLKDRKGRQMDDPAHYCKMATAIAKTIELQKIIDPLFTEAEKNIIEIKK